MDKVRISNDYLLAILSVLTSLGAQNVSSALIVEAWKASGHDCDDIFFMHFDTLLTYHFLQYAEEHEAVLEFDQLLSFDSESDKLVSITHEGTEFLHCFGGC